EVVVRSLYRLRPRIPLALANVRRVGRVQHQVATLAGLDHTRRQRWDVRCRTLADRRQRHTVIVQPEPDQARRAAVRVAVEKTSATRRTNRGLINVLPPGLINVLPPFLP